MKKFILYTLLTVVIAILNLKIYDQSLFLQTKPWLSDEQHWNGFLLMLKTTLPAYLTLAAMTSIAIYLLNTRHWKIKPVFCTPCLQY
ncbi:MAG: hypothetical protein HC848_08765 [Limnobacter sp.]|nr:hypothetical protein [Limnobacter sp.]